MRCSRDTRACDFFQISPLRKGNMDDVFALCAMQTPVEGALEALDAILKAGMPANIRVGELRDTSAFDQKAGLQHLVCAYATEDRYPLGVAMIDKLFEFGANWMLLDSMDNTPGDIAFKLNKQPLYKRFVEAGFRSEILLQRFAESDDENDLVDLSASAAAAADQAATGSDAKTSVEGNTSRYLQTELHYDAHSLKTSASDGVMMDWEEPIMRRSAQIITKPGGVVLNIGFGMGIIDGYIQQLSPGRHYIIEAHPTVLQRMKAEGWQDKKNVIVLEGTWKSVLPQLLEDGVRFDGIYYDTFSEHYRDMLILFDYVVGLLNFDGTFSFFNGLGADRQVCYDVYKRVSRFNLQDYGFSLTFEDVPVEPVDWQGVKYEYFKLNAYALPIVRFANSLEEEEGELLEPKSPILTL